MSVFKKKDSPEDGADAALPQEERALSPEQLDAVSGGGDPDPKAKPSKKLAGKIGGCENLLFTDGSDPETKLPEILD